MALSKAGFFTPFSQQSHHFLTAVSQQRLFSHTQVTPFAVPYNHRKQKGVLTMKDTSMIRNSNELACLCASVRAFVIEGAYESCMEPICQAMEHYPHAPEPHNLLGIVLEKMGDHLTAMKHFRAAWALDPTYRPANHNLNTYGTFFSRGKCAFDESDVPPDPPSNIEIEYDERGVGHVVYKTKIEYDAHGIGRVVRR